MYRSIFAIAFLIMGSSTLSAEEIYNCKGTFQNQPCKGGAGKPIQFEKRYSKTSMISPDAISEDARARFEFKRDGVLNELIEKSEQDTRPTQGSELQALAIQTKTLSDSLNRELERKGEQQVAGEIVQIRTRLQGICSQAVVVNDRSSRATCDRSLQQLASIEKKVSDLSY